VYIYRKLKIDHFRDALDSPSDDQNSLILTVLKKSPGFPGIKSSKICHMGEYKTESF